MKQQLNFSPHPFQTRPMPLAVLMLFNLGLALFLLGSIWYWFGLRNENQAVHNQIGELKARQRTVVGGHEDFVRELETINIGEYKKNVRQYHGIQVAYQTHWGRLLDDLGTILPEDVRIVRMTPTSEARNKDKSQETVIHLSAQARNKASQLAFIRKLQERPSFHDIRFESETYGQGEVMVSFEIRFTHRPGKGA